MENVLWRAYVGRQLCESVELSQVLYRSLETYRSSEERTKGTSRHCTLGVGDIQVPSARPGWSREAFRFGESREILVPRARSRFETRLAFSHVSLWSETHAGKKRDGGWLSLFLSLAPFLSLSLSLSLSLAFDQRERAGRARAVPLFPKRTPCRFVSEFDLGLVLGRTRWSTSATT